MTIYRILKLCLLIFTTSYITAQDIIIKNPSFEGEPQMGRTDKAFNLRGWQDASQYDFAYASPPDVHSSASDTSFWNLPMRKCHGETYLSLVVRDNNSWESVFQELRNPLLKDQCYEFSIMLARSDIYKSSTTVTKNALVNFTTPAVLQIWSYNHESEKRYLLATSKPVDHAEWKRYRFNLKPEKDMDILILSAYFIKPLFSKYNGHILLDDASPLIYTKCK